MPMTNLAQIHIDPKAFGKWAGRRRFEDEDTSTHALVAELFGRQVFQPYRYREIGGRGGILNGYTEASAVELQDMVDMAAGPDSIALIQGPILTKPIYVPKAGQNVGFEIKVMPVVRLDDIEIDSYLRDKDLGRYNDREVSYANWLTKRLERASDVRTIRLIRHSTYLTKRKAYRRNVTSAVMQGTVTVKDPEAFCEMISNGVGRHKAYGYGMLTLTAPDRV